MKKNYNLEKLRRKADTDRACAGLLINVTGRIRWNATFSSVYAKELNNVF